LDFDKTMQVYDAWRQTYPRDTLPLDNLSLLYSETGQFDKSLDRASQAFRLDPKDRFAYGNMTFAYLGLNRFDEARSLVDQALAQKLDGPTTQIAIVFLDAIRNDRNAFDRHLAENRGTSTEPLLLMFKAFDLCSQGKLAASRPVWLQSRALDQKAGDKDSEGQVFVAEAMCDALAGNPENARKNISEAMQSAPSRDVNSLAAIAFAIIGDAPKSNALLSDLQRHYPDNRFIQTVIIPEARAAQALHANQPAQAIAELEPLRATQLGSGPQGTGYTVNYLRGQAYLNAGDGNKAATEFQQILDRQGIIPVDPEYSLSHLYLARSYSLQGNAAKARTAYQDFFSVWKDSDPDVPILKEAKAEYEKLK
jgi:tetratricopeptide (TPR) repeat protein